MPSLIAVSLRTTRQFATAQRSGADFIELRTDFFSLTEIVRLAERSSLPIILTIKRVIAFPKNLPPSIKFIDFDYKTPQARLQNFSDGPKIIQSFHDYKATPPYAKLARIVTQAHQRGYLPKIATTIRTVDDLAIIARLQQKYGKRIIAIGMGELGLMTRLYNKSCLTFAALTPKTNTAPGQLTVAQLRSGMQLYGLIGDDIQHSLSPRLHNTWFKQHHLPHRYQLWETANLAGFMQVFNFFQLPGASVTKPYKKSVVQYCTKLNPHARAIGAVNTLVRRGRSLTGYNTDWLGVKRALGKSLRHANVLILGNGGAAQAVAYAAKQVHARQIKLLRHTDLPTNRTDFDVVINATPERHKLLVPTQALKHKTVMDCVYGKPTKFVRTAHQRSARLVLDGWPMLHEQAQEQFRLWTARTRP